MSLGSKFAAFRRNVLPYSRTCKRENAADSGFLKLPALRPVPLWFMPQNVFLIKLI